MSDADDSDDKATRSPATRTTTARTRAASSTTAASTPTSAPGAAWASTRTRSPTRTPRRRWRRSASERLDPDNRPDGAEVDNTDRTFDVDRGQFTDSEDYDESEPAPFSDPEDPNTDDDSDDDDSDDDSEDDDADDDSEDDDSDDDDDDEDDGESTAEGPPHRLRRLDRHASCTRAWRRSATRWSAPTCPGRGADVDRRLHRPRRGRRGGRRRSGPDAVIHLAGIPTESSLPDALQPRTSSRPAPCSRRWCGTTYAASSTPPATTPSVARRAPTLLGADVHGRPDTFYGVGKVAAEALLQPVRRPARHRRRQHPDRLVPASGRRPGASSRTLALPRRRRADVRRRADRARARASPCSTASPPTPAAGGTSSRAGRSATTRRTTPSSTPPRSRPTPETENDRAEAAHVGGPFATARVRATGLRLTTAIDLECARRARLSG